LVAVYTACLNRSLVGFVMLAFLRSALATCSDYRCLVPIARIPD